MSTDLHDQARTHNYLPGLSARVGVSVRGSWCSQIERGGVEGGRERGVERKKERGGWGRGRGRERGGGRETERETHRHRQKQTDRQADRDRDTERERGCEPAWSSGKVLLLVSRRTSRFDSASALLYLKKLQSVDIVL